MSKGKCIKSPRHLNQTMAMEHKAENDSNGDN